MSYQYGHTVNTKIRFFAAFALVAGLALALSASTAMATNNPIPGVDIIVKKNPGGIPVIHHSDASGKFFVQVKEPGQYTISTACQQSACPPYKISIKASGVPLKHGTGGNFTVGNGVSVVLSGQVQSASLENANDGRTIIDWGDGTPPGIMGDPIPGVDVNLPPSKKTPGEKPPVDEKTERRAPDLEMPSPQMNIPTFSAPPGMP